MDLRVKRFQSFHCVMSSRPKGPNRTPSNGNAFHDPALLVLYHPLEGNSDVDHYVNRDPDTFPDCQRETALDLDRDSH